MNIKRLAFWAGLLPLASLAQGQVFRAKTSAPTLLPVTRAAALAPAVPLAPVSMLPSLAPSLGAPALPALPSPVAAPAPAAATSEALSVISQAIAPDLARAADARQSGEASSGSAERVMAALLGPTRKTGALAAAPVSAVPGRKAPLVSGVAFAPSVTPEQQARFNESLARRKAGWTRGLTQAGIKLAGPVAPQLSVREVKEVSRGGVLQETSYTVDWSQGPTHVGSFKAVIAAKDPAPRIRSLGAPAVPAEKRLRIRFRSDVTPAQIEAFLEERRLRSLGRSYKNEAAAGVTGDDDAAAVARAVSGEPLVLYATHETFKPAESLQLTLRFKRGATEADIQKTLRENGVRVLSIGYEGEYLVALEEGSASAAAALLSARGPVLWASPKINEASEAGMSVVRFKDVSDDAVAEVLARHGLLVVKAYGERSFRVAGAAAALLAAEESVASAVAVGAVSDEQVRSYARGTASHKGRPWSSTEYNMAYAMGYDALELAGATEAQLALYRDLCDAAPVLGGGFNPWSGD